MPYRRASRFNSLTISGFAPCKRISRERAPARLPGCPQLLDVISARQLVAETCRGRKPLLVSVSPSRHRNGPLSAPRSPLTSEDHQLVAREQVRQALRLQVVELYAISPDREIGQNR